MASLMQLTLWEMSVAGLRTEEAFGQIRDIATKGEGRGEGGGGEEEGLCVCVLGHQLKRFEPVIFRFSRKRCIRWASPDGPIHILSGIGFKPLHRRYITDLKVMDSKI